MCQQDAAANAGSSSRGISGGTGPAWLRCSFGARNDSPSRQAIWRRPHRMNHSLSSIRWLRVLSAALAVMALSFLLLMVIVAVYAFVLAFEARGAPDQSAISHFAARVSPKVVPWLEGSLTFLAAVMVARRAEKASATHGLFIGILAGLLSLAVPLAFAGRLGLQNWVLFLLIVGLGWVGSIVGQKRTDRI